MKNLRELYKQWFKEMNCFPEFSCMELKTDRAILKWNKEDLFYGSSSLQEEDVVNHNKICVETNNKDLTLKKLNN